MVTDPESGGLCRSLGGYAPGFPVPASALLIPARGLGKREASAPDSDFEPAGWSVVGFPRSALDLAASLSCRSQMSVSIGWRARPIPDAGGRREGSPNEAFTAGGCPDSLQRGHLLAVIFFAMTATPDTAVL